MVDRSGDAAAIAAFLAQGGKVEKVEASDSIYVRAARRIASESGLSDRAERRLCWKLRTDRITIEEAEAQYLPEHSAEQIEERRREVYGAARLGGATVDQALDEANHVVR
jgi:hypothetical protein